MTYTSYATRQEMEAYEYRRALRRRRMKQRRQREIRRNIAMMLLGLLMIAGLSLSYHAITSHANSKLDTVEKKCFTSVLIEGEDTLWSIALEHADEHYNSVNEYVEEIKAINHLTSEQITAGNYLIIPYYITIEE